MELRASFDITPLPQLIGSLLDVYELGLLSVVVNALPWASLSPPQRNCESDTEENIARRKALHPRRRSSTS